MLTCEEIEERLPEYALGALDGQETVAVVQHIADCPGHLNSLKRYQAVCDALSVSVPLVEPPVRLKTRLLSQVAPRPASRRQPPVRLRSWAVAGLAAVVAIVLGVWGLTLQSRMDRAFAAVQSFWEVAGRSDAHRVELHTGAGPAKGVLFMADSQAAIWAADLPKPTGEQVFVCWWIDADNQYVYGGMFRAPQGEGVWVIPMLEEGRDYHALGITLEPNLESTEPHGPPLLVGEF